MELAGFVSISVVIIVYSRLAMLTTFLKIFNSPTQQLGTARPPKKIGKSWRQAGQPVSFFASLDDTKPPNT